MSVSDDFETISRKFKHAFYDANNSLTQHWFRDVWAPVTGVNLTAHAATFNHFETRAQRHLFVESGRLRVLLLRFEDIRHW